MERAPIGTETRRREAGIRALFESGAQAILAVDRAGMIVLANPRADAMFGYERGQLVGQRLEVLIPEPVRHVHDAHRASYFGQPHTRPLGAGLTLTGLRKDGREFPVEIALVHVPDEEGALAMALVTDLSERLEQERQARHRDQVAALGGLAVSISHELNNPIAILLSRVDLMLMELEDQTGIPPPIADQLLTDLQALHRQTRRLARSVLSLGHGRPPTRQPIDLGALVRDTAAVARTRLRQDIEVHAVVDRSVPAIVGDRSLLGFALLSLLLDLEATTPTGSVVRLETMVAREAGRPETARLVISYPGPGATEPSASASAVEDDPGLRLSLGVAIIRDQGVAVDVRAEPDLGTTITLDFPPPGRAA